ncbi:hypothetical protein B7P43_G08948 [Cryptotermes secundus]|uniref:Reverse transcriptase domain-containing protein n=1 Tax=Cryptotermes secundus TaxID=105785 RepID=A0A2J7QL10_9NEOP|nr:hypothetical protein B7P43_G08948 [Cryptotermes secundus]
MEMNVEKTKVMKISRQPTPATIKINQKQLENVKCFKYLGSLLTDDGRCTCEIKSRIAVAKAAFSKKKNLFTSKLDLNLRKKPVKCYIWSIALYGAETWTLRAVDQKHLESFEMWCWRRMEKISWTDYMRNEEVLISVSEQRNILHEIRKRKANWSGHILRGNYFLHVLQTGSGAHPASYPMCTGARSLGVKWPGREADHSSPTSAEARKMWTYTCTPPYVFVA